MTWLSFRVAGLDSGADDYLTKPFDFEELLARVRALLRLNTGTREAYRDRRRIELTAREHELLLLFLRHPRQVLLREQILDRVWGRSDGAIVHRQETSN